MVLVLVPLIIYERLRLRYLELDLELFLDLVLFLDLTPISTIYGATQTKQTIKVARLLSSWKVVEVLQALQKPLGAKEVELFASML